MTTGEGGMVTTNKKNLYKTMYSMRRFGMKKNKIFHDHISGNYKLSEFSALLGIIELKRINKRIRKRNQLAKNLL